MSFAVVVRDVLAECVEAGEEPSQKIQEALLETLKDPAVRRETFEHAFEELDDIDMMIVHAVMDGLVKTVSEEPVTIDG